MVLGVKCEAVGFRGQCMILSCPCLPTMWVDPLGPFSTHAWHLLVPCSILGTKLSQRKHFYPLKGLPQEGRRRD